jgi:pyridoxal phosphate phosphatase PHOSPHO2
MPKENYPLWDLICSNKQFVKAEVHPWSSGKELENTLLMLVNKLIGPPEPTSQLDYKCEMSHPASTEVGRSQALPVPH